MRMAPGNLKRKNEKKGARYLCQQDLNADIVMKIFFYLK